MAENRSEPRSEHRALLAVDMAGSSAPDRNDRAMARARDALFGALESAFDRSAVPWRECEVEDQGDGCVVRVPARFPKAALVHPLLGTLSDLLHEHNEFASASTRVRVRAVLHAGELAVDGRGMTGRTQVVVARLLDCAALRAALADAPSAAVALAVSERFYEDVVEQGGLGIRPDDFWFAEVGGAGSLAVAWLTVVGERGRGARRRRDGSGRDAGVGAGRDVGTGPRSRTGIGAGPVERRPTGGFTFNGATTFHGDAVGGDKHVWTDEQGRNR
ncbi:hypothetical protein KCV87_21025 [Actinosynnema pretiosum subsp. pretiosum]|uniref:Guanylate cyclase domain-containing protein n=1 Tax=Actinosynnema pretiosum subsp. pretiosum TaxID=103721 RepID=A0AA45L261_9PSEU|nr:hypothetical protein APASM_6925 [Actinosynnema pretiosum subsp. pretiosum]QUF02002.1 hypothetical protein KCV87_21025 [Actinosynnema pretiosum subsp. pretiosum]